MADATALAAQINAEPDDVAPIDKDELLSLHRQLVAQFSGRNGEYEQSRRYYRGHHWNAAVNPAPLNRYSLTLNYLKPFIDKSVQLLVGRMPGIQVMPPGVDDASRTLAEQMEGVLYGTWSYNDAATELRKTAYDSFILRRGLIYTWWDPAKMCVRFRNVVPDNFYPVYDGDEVVECVYVSRRLTKELVKQYPDNADEISGDAGYLQAPVFGQEDRVRMDGQTTVIDWFNRNGAHARIMGDAFLTVNDLFPFDRVPFVEFPCTPIGGETEPLNLIDQIVELNQYLDQLVSQNADVIKKWSNPPILDGDTGQRAEDIRAAVASEGSVIPMKRGGTLSLLNWEGTAPGIKEQIQFVMDALFDLAGKPRSAFGQTITNQSGVVTNLMLTPTLQSNEDHETLWGHGLSQLNEMILRLWERYSYGEQIVASGRKYTGVGDQTKYYDVKMLGGDIGGWYKNRIKWPSSIRTDDPAYVTTKVSRMTSDPPTLSLYSGLEELGVEDVEMEISRIGKQLQDPRLHPDRLAAMTQALAPLQASMQPGANVALDGMVPPPQLGPGPGGLGAGTPLPPGPGVGAAQMDGALTASGEPGADEITQMLAQLGAG